MMVGNKVVLNHQ